MVYELINKPICSPKKKELVNEENRQCRPSPFTFQELLDALLGLPEDSPKLKELVSLSELIKVVEAHSG